MNKPPAFQFYAKDFLTGTMAMSLVERGAYITLLAWSWDKGPVPLSEAKRATILGLSRAAFRRLWEGLRDNWAEQPEGYVNRRLEQQRAALAAFTAEQAEKGKRGAAKRWPKHGRGHPTANTEPLAEAIPDDSSSVSDLQSPKETLKKEPSESLRAREALFERFWKAYPKKVGKGGALRKFMSLKPDQRLVDRMLAALEWQISTPKWKESAGEYIPHPETWLNKHRWEDEPFHADVSDPLAANDAVWAEVEAKR